MGLDGVMCQNTLNWVLSYVRDFERYTYLLHDQANSEGHWLQSTNRISPLPVLKITLKFEDFPLVFMARVCERTFFNISDFLFFKLFLPSVLLNIRREYSPSRIPIRIQRLKFAMFLQSVIVVFFHSVFSRVIILSLTPKKYIYSRYLWTTCLPINMTFTGTLSIAPNWFFQQGQ